MKTLQDATPTGDAQEQELELCISCLESNAPGTHFCRHCGTPLTSYAATAPFESIFAEGDMWRKAVRRDHQGEFVRIMIVAFLVCLVLSILLGWILPR